MYKSSIEIDQEAAEAEAGFTVLATAPKAAVLYRELTKTLSDHNAVVTAEVIGVAKFDGNDVNLSGNKCYPRRSLWSVETILGTFPMDLSECEVLITISNKKEEEE